MALSQSLTQEFTHWITSVKDASATASKNYFSLDVVLDSFEHGVAKGREEKERELRELTWKNHINQGAEFSGRVQQVLGLMRANDFKPKQLLMGYADGSFKALIIVNAADHDRRDFIDLIYRHVASLRLDAQRQGWQMSVAFLSEESGPDYQMLQDHGFSFHLDLTTGEIIKPAKDELGSR